MNTRVTSISEAARQLTPVESQDIFTRLHHEFDDEGADMHKLIPGRFPGQ